MQGDFGNAVDDIFFNNLFLLQHIADSEKKYKYGKKGNQSCIKEFAPLGH